MMPLSMPASTQGKPPIVQALWLQFTNRAKIKIEGLLGQDRSDGSQDIVYARVLKALSRISPAEAGVLIEWLHDWRNGFSTTTMPGASPKKKLAVEVVFLEALVKMVSGSGVQLSKQQFNRLEDTSINWVMRPNEYVEKHPELRRLQEQVTALSSQLLGVLSELDLKRIKERFLAELTERLPKENPTERQQLLNLCMGMKSIRLGFRDSSQLDESRMFVRDASPMRHVAPVRKSQVQHAICTMMSAIIKPYVEHDIPRHDMYLYDAQRVESWFTTVELIRQEITKWNKSHAKHGAVGYPLITQLTCLLDDDTFLTLVDQEKGGSYVDTLHKQLKDKTMRTLVLDCLQQLIHTYCQRFAPPCVGSGTSPYRPLSNDRVNSWLDKTTRPLMAGMRKGMFPLQEQQEIMKSMCVLVCHHVPEFAIAKMVMELMVVEGGSWECMVQGLRALREILITAPNLSNKAKVPDAVCSGVVVSDAEAPYDSLADKEELMDMVRRGTTAFDMYGIKRLEMQVSRALSQILLHCHNAFGQYRMTNTARVVDAIPKERLPGLMVLAAAIRCVPYILPEHWRGSKFAEDLAWYTIHADPSVRSVAFQVLRRALRSYPDQREMILHGMCTMVSNIADEHDRVIADSVVHIDQLMQDWMQLLGEHDADSASKYMDPLTPSSRRLDAHRIEGMAVALLCHTDMTVRLAGWRILNSVRQLHSQLVTSQLPSMTSMPNTPASTTVSEQTGTGEGPTMYFIRSPEEDPTYLIDIIHQAGPELLSNFYWDFGRWSDLWRLYRHVDDAEGLEVKSMFFRRGSSQEAVRCARILSEVVRQAGQLCRAASHWTYVEICNRMKGAGVLMDEGGGRYSFPMDLSENRKELVIVYTCVAVAANLLNRRDVPQPPVSMLELCRALVNAIRGGSDWQAHMAQLALGHCNAAHYDKVIQELQDVIREYSGPALSKASKGRTRKEDLRIAVGHILRQIADVLPPGKLKTSHSLRNELMKFIKSTSDFVNDPMNRDEVSSDLLQLRYCLCGVAKCVGLQLGRAMPTLFSTELRHSLFDMFAQYCKEGFVVLYGRSRDFTDDQYRNDLRERILTKTRSKDGEAAKRDEAELIECAEMLDHAAGQAMAAMLMGPLLDSKSRSKEGKAFSWIDRMMKVPDDSNLNSEAGRCGPSKYDVAVRALTYFLESNQDVFLVVLDQCYSAHPAVANGYFQVLVEVYAMRDIPVQSHMLLSLVLHKLVDESRDVRADALQLLNVLSRREWHQDPGVTAAATPGKEDGKVAVVIGGVQDSFQQFQYHLSAKLARNHPELSEALCVEMMTRQLDVPALKHHVLTCLIPWIENLSFAPKWEGNWSGSLLQAMYYVTLQHGHAFPYEIERLWSTVASNKRNIIPIVDFLIAKGLEECDMQMKAQILQYFSVSKRIGLYMARMSPQQTIDHMAYEITQLFLATDEQLGPQDHDNLAFKPLEFQHPLPSTAHLMTRSQSLPSNPNITPLNTAVPRSYKSAMAITTGPIRKGFEFMKTVGMARSESGSSRYSPSHISVPDFSIMKMHQESYSPTDMSRHASSEDIHVDSDKARALTRPELALCLLADIAYEHDEDLRSHLPLLCHTAVILMDSEEGLLYHHCQHALIHLLYSLSARHLEIHHATGALLSEYRQVSRLIKYLQAMAGRRLWVCEDATLENPRVASCRALESLVQELVGSVFFESDLKERWRDEALKWMVEGSHQHLACRSHQVYRALRPAMTLRSVSALLSGLHKCLANPTHKTIEVAIEIMLTLQCLVDSTDPSKLLLYPQLFLVCLPLLTFSYVHLFTLTLELFSKMLKHLDLNNVTVQNVLLVSCPVPRPHDDDDNAEVAVSDVQSNMGWIIGNQLFGAAPTGVPGGKLWAVQQLLLKGMFRPEAELLTVQALIQVAQHVANAQLGVPRHQSFLTHLSLVEGMGKGITGIGATMGDPELQVVLTLWGLLPWLCVRAQQKSKLAKVCVKVLRYACASVGFTEVAHSLADFHTEDESSLTSSVSHLCAAICKATFPKYAKLALQRLMDTLQSGVPSYGSAVLLLTHCILHSPGVQLGGVLAEPEAFVLEPVAALMDGPLGPQALEVLEGVLHYTSLHSDVVISGTPAAETLDWPRCTITNAYEANKMAVAAFGRIIESHTALKAQRSVRIMPFVATPPHSRKTSQVFRES